MEQLLRDAEASVIGWQESAIAAGEKADCFVLALAIITNMPYDTSHLFSRTYFSRKDKRGVDVFTITKVFKGMKFFMLGHTQFSARVLPLGEIQTSKTVNGMRVKHGKTLKSFLQSHPTGSYILILKGHAIALKDGIFYDGKTNIRSRRGIQAAIRISENVKG